MIKSITVLGSSSGKNAGDAALLAGLMEAIDTACGRKILYEIPTYRPYYIWNNYQTRVRPVSMQPFWGSVGMFGAPTAASLLRSSMTLVFDAPLFDRKIWNPLTNYLPPIWLAAKTCKSLGKKFGLYNVGAGPVTTDFGRRLLADTAKMADFITIRDSDSYNLLAELGASEEKMLITADAAIPVSASPKENVDQILKELGLFEEGEILAININGYINSWAGADQAPISRDQFTTTYGAALSEALEELGHPQLLFVCTQHNDISITEELMGKTKTKGKKRLFSNIHYNHHDTKGVFGRVSFLFAMRLHASILATSMLTPASALIFQIKVSSYYDLLGLKDKTLSFKDFSKETVRQTITQGWRDRQKTKEILKQKIPFLATEALKAAEIVAAADRGECPLALIKNFKTKKKETNHYLTNGKAKTETEHKPTD